MPIGFFKNIIQKFTGKPVDWDELEETLIRADLGVSMSMKILNSLRARDKQLTTKDSGELEEGEGHSPAKITAFLALWTPTAHP